MSEMNTETGIVPEWTLGWRIQRAADFAGITVEQLGSELEMSRSTISRWMHDGGKVRDIYLRAIALRCGVPFVWLKTGAAPNAATDDTYRGTTHGKVADRGPAIEQVAA